MKRLAILLVGAMIALGGCSSAPGTGAVEGIFETVGGPLGAAQHGVPGRVVFTDDQGARTSVEVTANGTFHLDLAPGAYTAVGRSPEVHSDGEEMACHSRKPLQVRSGSVVTVTVACQIM